MMHRKMHAKVPELPVIVIACRARSAGGCNAAMITAREK